MLHEQLSKREFCQARGGVSLLYAATELDKIQTSNSDENMGVQIIKNALKAPTLTIAGNAGVDGAVVVGKLLEQENLNLGYDAAKASGIKILEVSKIQAGCTCKMLVNTDILGTATGEYVDMVEAGIIDPLKVVRTALVDAASVSVLLTSTEAAVVELPDAKCGPKVSRMAQMDDMDY
ncbi:unnamed protein product [Musa textilis]